MTTRTGSITLVKRSDFRKRSTCHLCHTPFTSTFRRHHCRVCGESVCNNCSERHGYVCEQGKNHRMCKECKDKMNRGNSKTDQEDISEREKKEFSRIDSLPTWFFAFYPLAQYTISTKRPVRYGILHVNVLEAKNLVASDVNLVSGNTSDPYCKVSFGAIKRVQAKTDIVFRTLNPRWNHRQRFDVVYPESTLKIEVWDYDQMDSHDFLGELELPVSLFRNKQMHDCWYNLKPYDNLKRGRIRLQVRFEYTKKGEMFSHFIPKEIPEEVTPALDINKLFAYAMELLDQIEPFKQFPSRIVAVLQWENPLWTVHWIVMFYYLMNRPHLIIPYLHLCLLYYIWTKYTEKKFREDEYQLENYQEQVKEEEKKEKKESEESSKEEENEAMLDRVSPETQETSKGEDLEEKEEKEIMAKNTLGGKGSMVNMILKATPGAQESLANLQVSCESGVAGVKALYRLFDWSDSAKTKGVTYVVVFSTRSNCNDENSNTRTQIRSHRKYDFLLLGTEQLYFSHCRTFSILQRNTPISSIQALCFGSRVLLHDIHTILERSGYSWCTSSIHAHYNSSSGWKI